jgi:peptidyl-prolyl cis-trans isomerase SurA
MGQQGGQQQEIPPYEKVKPQLEEQAESQRVGTVATELVEKLREDADITINL